MPQYCAVMFKLNAVHCGSQYKKSNTRLFYSFRSTSNTNKGKTIPDNKTFYAAEIVKYTENEY